MNKSTAEKNYFLTVSLVSGLFQVELFDVLKQFAERARTVIEQRASLVGGCLRGIADSAARMQILRGPRVTAPAGVR